MSAMSKANGFERRGVPMPFERKKLYETMTTPSMPRAITANTFRADMRSVLSKSRQRREIKSTGGGKKGKYKKKKKTKKRNNNYNLTRSTTFLGYPMMTPTKNKMKKSKSEKLIVPTTAARPKLQRDLNKVINQVSGKTFGSVNRNNPPITHNQVHSFWKEQENIILGNVKNARANKAIEEHKLEALERDKKRKKESIKLKNQAVLDRIIEKNMMRRSYKDRMEAVAKKREMKKLERLKKEKLRRKKNRNRPQTTSNIHTRLSPIPITPGPGDYDPVQGYNYQTCEYAPASFTSKRSINTPKNFSFVRKPRFKVKYSDVPGPGTYESINPRNIQKVKHHLPPPTVDESTEDKTRFRGSILQYLGPRSATAYDFRSSQGWLYASADHALGKNLPGPNKYIINDEAVRPGTCAGRISTAYPMSEFDIIVNRAAKLPSPMEYYINDNAIRRSPSFRISTAKPPSYIDLAERLSKQVPGP